MYKYIVLASDEEGKFSVGIETGEGMEDVLHHATKRWRYVLMVLKTVKILNGRRDRQKAGELSAFFERLYMMIRAGIPVCKALNIMSIAPGAPGKYAQLLYGGVSRGDTIAACMKRSPSRFSEMAQKLVESGESSGNIELSCKKLSQYYNKIEQTKKEMMNLSLYPIIVLTFSIITFISVQVIILPRFSELIYSNGIEIKGYSKLILEVSMYVRSNLPGIFMLVIGAAAAAGAFFKGHSKADFIEGIMLKVPCTRRLYANTVAMVFSQVMGMTISSGMNIIECIDSCKGIFRGREYCKAIESIKKKISMGEGFSKSMAKTGIFPEELVSIVGIGESSGDIGEIFENMSAYYEKVMQLTIKRMVSIMGPMLIVFISVVIGVMLYLIIKPIMGSLNSII